MKTGWENGQRIPVSDRQETEDESRRPERGALIMVRRLVGMFLTDTNPSLGAQCMALVTGICYEGSSMVEIARRHGCTRASVSTRCVKLCNSFGIPPVRAMRPEKNRNRCRKSRVLTQTEPDDQSQDCFRQSDKKRVISLPTKSLQKKNTNL